MTAGLLFAEPVRVDRAIAHQRWTRCAAQRGIVMVACLAFGLIACDSARSSQATAHYDVELPAAEPQGPSYQDADVELRAGPPEPCRATGVLAPHAGYSRFAIPVSISARSQRQVPSGPMLFSLLMDGQLHRPTLASCKAPFAARQLQPGEQMQSHVVFDLPALTPPLKLIFEPFIIGRQPVRAQVLVPARSNQEP